LVLAAPTLRCEDRTLHWTPVFTASAYILERGYSLGTDLLAGSEVYRGPDVSYEVPAGSLSMAYRVKATEGVFSEDSPWSNIVEPLGLHPIPSTSEPGVPAAPSLTIKPRPLAWDISWTEVPDATSYVLERKQTMRGSLFADSWERVYEGTGTGFSDLRAAAGATSGLCTYRVKALGPWGETAWGF
jgi:hypothetical protein